ncbi:MAG: hypothetical protein RIB84_25405 [Sneathiellaceae bacterium]
MKPTRHDNQGADGGPQPGGGPQGGTGAGFRDFAQDGATGMPDGAPLRRMVGGISAVMVIVWTLLWLAFYALIELLGNVLVWLSRTIFEAQGMADFFAGVFGFLQDLGFVTIAIIWAIGVVLAIGFNLVTHRATRDAEARWSQRRGDHAHPVGADGSDGTDPSGGPRRRPRRGSAAPRRDSGRGSRRPVTIDLRRDGDTYR